MRQLPAVHRLMCVTGVAALLMTGLAGCGPAETGAEFEPGDEKDVLDGATIQDDGAQFELTMDGARQQLARVDIDGGDRSIEFDSELSAALGLPVPRSITTSSNRIEFDARTGVGAVTVEVPLMGVQSFTFETGGGPTLFGLGALPPPQPPGGCTAAVAGLDEFCELFQAHGPAALDQGIDLALQVAKREGYPDQATGFIEQVVTDFYNVVQDFCDAWTEVRDGSSEKDPVDPCGL
jgi:hypothetical protein